MNSIHQLRKAPRALLRLVGFCGGGPARRTILNTEIQNLFSTFHVLLPIGVWLDSVSFGISHRLSFSKCVSFTMYYVFPPSPNGPEPAVSESVGREHCTTERVCMAVCGSVNMRTPLLKFISHLCVCYDLVFWALLPVHRIRAHFHFHPKHLRPCGKGIVVAVPLSYLKIDCSVFDFPGFLGLPGKPNFA